MSPAVWGEMTLKEFQLAMQGFNDLENDRRKWNFFTARRICYFIAKTTGNDLKEEEIIPIEELDEIIEKRRIEDLPIVQVVVDGTDERK